MEVRRFFCVLCLEPLFWLCWGLHCITSSVAISVQKPAGACRDPQVSQHRKTAVVVSLLAMTKVLNVWFLGRPEIVDFLKSGRRRRP